MVKQVSLFFALIAPLCADPLLSSWDLNSSRSYARLYQFQSDVDSGTSNTTWVHPNSGVTQAQPTYAGIHEVSYDSSFVYLRTTGMGAHVMGPWWRNRSNSMADAQIFVNWPVNQELVVSIPRLTNLATPTSPSPRVETGGGAIGLFVDGVSMFDSRDAFSFDSDQGVDEQPNSGPNITGDGYWERDAFVNESQTFDDAFAHSAGATYHYHANPPALRHRLGDSVIYDPATNTYEEEFNGNHSPILGWVRDGLPIYGPYGYSDPMDATSDIRQMVTGYRPRTDLASNGSPRDSYPAWATRLQGALPTGFEGPDISAQFPRGHYLQDYEYLGDVGQTIGVDFDLDQFNTRFCVTPEFPNGVRAYFVSIEEDGTPKFPYNIGRVYYADPTGASYNNSDTRANNDFTPPAGVVVYAEGGPENGPEVMNIDTDSDNVVLTWSGVEGGTYEITTSDDLATFEEMQDKTASGSAIIEHEDVARLAADDRRFYRLTLESVAPFDDEGFQLEDITPTAAPVPFTITLDVNGPADLSILPNFLTINGEAIEVISRPSINELTVAYNPSDFSDATLTATFPDGTVATAPITGTSLETSNVLFILIDDWGIDSSPVDNPDGQNLPIMPNFVSLANESVRFENAYVSPSCSPTRMSIMSGRHPSSNGVGSPGALANNRDATSITTIAEAIDHPSEGVDYISGLIGKWHLGNGIDPSNVNHRGPQADGWDHFVGTIQGNLPSYTNWVRSDIDENVLNQTGQPSNETNYATTVNVDDALDFINANDSGNWLCWVAFNAPHSPFETPPLTLNGATYPIPAAEIDTDREKYEAMLWALDNEIGRLLQGVDLTTTTVIFLGDNGTPNNIIADENLFPSNHGKGSVYEGGARVPFLIRPAGGTTGTVKSELVNGVDLDTAERYAVTETFENNSNGNNERGIRKGNYKLVIFDNPMDATDIPSLEFFDLTDGIDESPSDNLLRGGNTLTPVEQNAFDGLITFNDGLNVGHAIQFDTNVPLQLGVITTSINLSTVTTTGGTIPPLSAQTGVNIDISSLTIGGVPATNFSRTTNGTNESRNWITFDFDVDNSGLPTGSYDIVVTYNTPNPRVVTFTNGYVHP